MMIYLNVLVQKHAHLHIEVQWFEKATGRGAKIFYLCYARGTGLLSSSLRAWMLFLHL